MNFKYLRVTYSENEHKNNGVDLFIIIRTKKLVATLQVEMKIIETLVASSRSGMKKEKQKYWKKNKNWKKKNTDRVPR